MVNYQWNFLELFANADKLISVRYLLTGSNESNVVESEGNHTFSDGIVNKALSEIVESDITQWIEIDTTVNNVNPIKSTIENQLNQLENIKKVDFPWLAGTFTFEETIINPTVIEQEIINPTVAEETISNPTVVEEIINSIVIEQGMNDPNIVEQQTIYPIIEEEINNTNIVEEEINNTNVVEEGINNADTI